MKKFTPKTDAEITAKDIMLIEEVLKIAKENRGTCKVEIASLFGGLFGGRPSRGIEFAISASREVLEAFDSLRDSFIEEDDRFNN